MREKESTHSQQMCEGVRRVYCTQLAKSWVVNVAMIIHERLLFEKVSGGGGGAQQS